MLHFAQAGIALVAAGGAVLIIAGLVREGQHFHLFPEAHDPPELPVANPVETAAAKDAGPYPHSRGKDARLSKRSPGSNDRAARKEKRRGKKRNGAEEHGGTGSRATTAETENA